MSVPQSLEMLLIALLSSHECLQRVLLNTRKALVFLLLVSRQLFELVKNLPARAKRNVLCSLILADTLKLPFCMQQFD